MKSIPLLISFYWMALPFTSLVSGISGLLKRNISKSDEYATNYRKEMTLVALEGCRKGMISEWTASSIDTILKLHRKTVGDIVFEDIGQLG